MSEPATPKPSSVNPPYKPDKPLKALNEWADRLEKALDWPRAPDAKYTDHLVNKTEIKKIISELRSEALTTEDAIGGET